MLDRTWTPAQLGHALCDALVTKGQLKEKPAFIRADRESKIVGVFESIGLDGEKMQSFDNPGPLEMLIRKGTNGEAWVQQVLAALIEMLPEGAAKATKKMGMDEDTKVELEAAKEKSAVRRERAEERQVTEGGDGRRPVREGGNGAGWGGDRDQGSRRPRDEGGGRFDKDERGGREFPRAEGSGRFDQDEGGRGERNHDRAGGYQGGGGRPMQCFNCGGDGHSARDCTEPPKAKGGGKGKGGGDRKNRKEMQCANCKGLGHKSRDCPEPVDEEALAQRLAVRRAKEDAKEEGGSD